MISTIMLGMCACMLLGHFWGRFNWQGAIASLIGCTATSVTFIFQDNWMLFWGNPVVPSLSLALFSGIIVSLVTPKSARTKGEAFEVLAAEPNKMESGSGKLGVNTPSSTGMYDSGVSN